MTAVSAAPARSGSYVLGSLGGLLVLATGATALATGPMDAGPNTLYLALLTVGGVVMAAGWRVADRVPRRVALLTVVAVGVTARLLLVPTTPALSTDLYRYLWDGTVQASGTNPYVLAPSSPELAELRDPDVWPRINRKDELTIYPGGAQLVFAAARQIGVARPATWKLFAVAVELVVLLLLWRLIRRRDGGPRDLLLYAWNPLPILAFAGSGHVDVLAVAAIVAAASQWQHGRRPATGALLGAAAAIKLYPLLLLPAFLRDRDGRWRWSVPAAAFGVLALTYLPYVAAGSDVLGYLTSGYLREEGYVSGRRFVLAGMLGVDGITLAVVVAGAVSVWALWTHRDVTTRSVALLGAALVLTTPYGWYASPLVALAAATPPGPALEQAPSARLLWPLFGASLYAVYGLIFFGLRPVAPVTMRRVLIVATLAATLAVASAVVRSRRRPSPAGAADIGVSHADLSGISVVMPAWDEADALPAALEGRPDGLHVIVVDNASTDGTADVALRLGCDVVHEPHRGFGAACLAGTLAAPADHVIVFADADGTFAWDDIVRVGQTVERGIADLAIGWRDPQLREPDSMPWHVAAANRALGHITGLLAGVPLKDIGPLRAIRRARLLELDLQDRTYGWPLEMVLRAGQADLRVLELPVIYQVRVGRSKVTGRPGATAAAAARMFSVLTRLGFGPTIHATSAQPEAVTARGR